MDPTSLEPLPEDVTCVHVVLKEAPRSAAGLVLRAHRQSTWMQHVDTPASKYASRWKRLRALPPGPFVRLLASVREEAKLREEATACLSASDSAGSSVQETKTWRRLSEVSFVFLLLKFCFIFVFFGKKFSFFYTKNF